MSINNVILTGNLTRDPELRSTASGTAVLQFSMAVNDRVKEGNEWKDRPNYFDCTMFGSRAESLARFLSKGSKIAVQGKLHWSQWEKDGQKRSKVEIYPDTIELLSPKKDGSQPYQSGSQSGYQKDMGTVRAEETFGVAMQPVQEGFSSIYDEDIPF